jgi:hypothetical protein
VVSARGVQRRGSALIVGVGVGDTSKIDREKGSGSAATPLPGRKLATSKIPRMLKPFEIDILRQDLKRPWRISEQPGTG